MARHHTARVASAMAFNLFLAAIPMLALAGWLLVTVLHGNPETLHTTSSLLNITPEYVRSIFDRHFGRFSAGAVAPVAILGSLWLASGAFHTLMTVFETALQAEPRSWWKKRLIAFGCVIVAILALGFGVPVAVTLSDAPARLLEQLLQVPVDRVRYGGAAALVVGLATLAALFAGFYRIALRRPRVRRRVWPGAAVTVTIGGFASSALAFYAEGLARFALFYGSLAAVAVLLAWLWLWCAAILLGGELNTQLENEALEPERTSLGDSEEV
jgi:membrane protein